MSTNHMAAFVLAVMLIAVGVYDCTRARSQDCVEGSYGCGHAENHDGYKNWRQAPNFQHPNGMSCCEPQECRPVRAIEIGPKRWIWWNGERWSEPVPQDALLPKDLLHDGRCHACGPRPGQDGKQETYCFSPCDVRS